MSSFASTCATGTHPRERTGDLSVKGIEIGVSRAGLRPDDDIAAVRQLMLVSPGEHTEPALHRIAYDRMTDRLRYGETKSPMRFGV